MTKPNRSLIVELLDTDSAHVDHKVQTHDERRQASVLAHLRRREPASRRRCPGAPAPRAARGIDGDGSRATCRYCLVDGFLNTRSTCRASTAPSLRTQASAAGRPSRPRRFRLNSTRATARTPCRRPACSQSRRAWSKNCRRLGSYPCRAGTSSSARRSAPKPDRRWTAPSPIFARASRRDVSKRSDPHR